MHYHIPHWMIVHMPHPSISCNFFMSIIVKHQPLHKPSMQTPHTITAIFVILDYGWPLTKISWHNISVNITIIDIIMISLNSTKGFKIVKISWKYFTDMNVSEQWIFNIYCNIMLAILRYWKCFFNFNFNYRYTLTSW